MRNLTIILLICGLAHWTLGYSAYQRPVAGSYSSGYSSSSHYSSNAEQSNCCMLSSWGYSNLRNVREFGNRLRLEYNHMSQGSSTGYNNPSGSQPWSESLIHLTGKTSSELDALCRRISEELVTDMRKGSISYSQISHPDFFQWKAESTLQSLSVGSSANLQQQQETLDLGQVPLDVSNFDEVQNVAYPAEVQIIDGKTYVVHKNCTEAQTGLPGAFSSNSYNGNNRYTSGTYGGMSYVPSGGSSTTTITRKKTVYDYVEPNVMGYRPVINVDSRYTAGGSTNSYRPTVHIPVDGSSSSNSFNRDVETFSTGNQIYRPSYNPGSSGSTVTIRRFNKTIITNPDGTNTVSGSELNRKWVDGKLVYDTERPFGEWTVPRDDDWKREERERLFWFLTQANSTLQQLEQWQRQQEERLLAMAERYHTTIEEIHQWHRQELERYRVLLGQYQAQTNHVTGWKRIESGRLDWLIHQNSVTHEELQRWQRENQDKLQQLARQYRISLEELQNWQIEELNRLYVYFNDQNNSMMTRPISSGSLQISEQERLEELIRQHNATISQLHNSIKLDQRKLTDLSLKYKGNVQDMEKWLKGELDRLGGIMNEQRNQMTRITEWQQTERQRLENMLKTHQGSVGDLDAQIEHDRAYIRSLAAKYHVSIEEIEKWQHSELERLHNEGQKKLDYDIKQWQLQERARLTDIIKKNDLTIEEFQTMIMNDKARLNNLAQTYKIQVTEVEDWIKNEIKNFQSQGLLKEVEKELALWQQKERARLQTIVQQNELTIEELETQIKGDQGQLYNLANKYKVHVSEIEEWLKQELLRLQAQGLVKSEDLKEWQKQERSEILKLVQQNRLTIEEFERKLLDDRRRLQNLSNTYNVETTEIENWIKKEGDRLQSMGLLKMQEQLNNWQQIERDRLRLLVTQNNLSIQELEEKIKKDQVHLYSLAHQHQVRVEEIEEWIKKEIKRLQQEGLVEMSKLKDWQTEWRGNLTNMVVERDLTVDEFHKWLLEDRARLQSMAMQHNVQIEEIEQWMKNEEQRFISMGLLKPNEKLTNWQEVERRYLERITQEQYHSTEQLEQRLRQDRELLEKLAREYSIQVEEVENWMKKELSRLRDDGQLQIDNLTSWQIAERERLEALSKQNKQWSVEEYETLLRQDREQMQKMAFQYHTSVEEIEKWIQSEIDRLRQQGKLDIDQLTAWQKTEQQRIMNLLQEQSSITVEEFERKIQQDRNFIIQLANQYHVSVVEVEEYVKKVVEDLRQQGKLEAEKLAAWQRVERDYIKELIAQYNNGLSTEEYEKKLLADRVHLQQLSSHYRISVEEIEKWMISELQHLRTNSAQHINKLAAWQQGEAQRLQNLINQNKQITYVEFQVELLKERERLQQLAKQYSLNVEQIEHWLRQQLINLKSTGKFQVESLTKWQDDEQQRLINMMLQQQKNISYEEFERKLAEDRARLQKLAQQYSVSIEEIEKWNREELQRLNNSGLVQIEQLNIWQRQERERLQNWLKQQNNAASLEQINEFLERDKQRLQRISQDYHVTVEEVESWVVNEGARLQLIGMVQQPNVYVTDNTEIWKTQTRAHLEAMNQIKPMNWQEFENYLKEQRVRWEQFARAYNISVQEIEYWLTESAKELVKQGVIQPNVEVEEWQSQERIHIDNLINERLRKQQQWTLEELELQLRNDRAHLEDLKRQYQLSIEQIELWYKQELQRLLNYRRIISEHLSDWQRREKARIYNVVVQQPYATLEVLEQKLLSDKNTLSGLADLYHISIEELELFIRNELQRYVLLGVIRSETGSQTSEVNNWQQQERARLHTIATDISITEQELIEYIAQDKSYQHQLTGMYGCNLDQLATFQRTEISGMQQQGLLDNTKLLTVLPWQREERERIYKLIKNQNINKKKFRDYQRQMQLQTMLAEKYRISVQELKDWQLKEFERLEQLAEQHRMLLTQLQTFRDQEVSYINYIMHKKTSTESERSSWASNEASRMSVLQQQTGLGGAELLAWRRRLYLLCQGRLPLDFGGYGGYENGRGSTNRTAPPHQDISMDRGDQPPHIYEENGDGSEPGIEGQQPLYPPPSAELRSTPAPQQYLPPARGPAVIPTPVNLQRTYQYKETKYKHYSGPVGGVSASAAASADMQSSSASASVSNMPVHSSGSEYESHTMTRGHRSERDESADLGQQQQVDLGWNEQYNNGQKDLGQQVQVEDLSDGRYTAAGHQQQQQQLHNTQKDLGQQVQVEDLSGGRYTAAGHGQQQLHNTQKDLRQQLQVEDLNGGRYTAVGHRQQQHHNTQEDLGQQVQVEDLSGGRYTATGHHQVDDFGQQQQVELADYKHDDNGQQQVQVEDLDGTFTDRRHYGASEKQVSSSTESQIVVTAEPEPTGFFGKLKNKIWG